MLKDLHIGSFDLDAQYTREPYSMGQTVFPLCPKLATSPGTRNLSPSLPYPSWPVQKRSRFFVNGVALTRQAKVRWQKEMKTLSFT